MTIQDKFDKVLKTNTLGIKSIFGLEQYCKVGTGSISKFLNKNESPKLGTIKKFQDALRINPEWWESENGSIYLEKPTPGDKDGDNKEIGMEVGKELKQLIEQNDRYSLVPNIILTQYEIQSKEEILRDQEVLKKALEYAEQVSKTKDVVIQAKNDLISELKKEIAELRGAAVKTAVPAQQA